MSKRLRRDDWVQLALAHLAARGPDGLTIEALCAAAQRTRGSLYHHFRDHDALLQAVLEGWRLAHTEAVITQVEAHPGGAAPLALSQLALALDPRLEVGIRQLAARHPHLRPLVRSVDARRIAFLASLYVRDGLDPADAEVLAEVEYAAYVGLQHMDTGRSPQQLVELYARFTRLLRHADPPGG